MVMQRNKIFILIMVCFSLFACVKKENGVICELFFVSDNYKKKLEKMEEPRVVSFSFWLTNQTNDSIFIPFNRYSHEYKSNICARYKRQVIPCSTAIWKQQSTPHIIAPHEAVKIVVELYDVELKKLGISPKIPLIELSKGIDFFYDRNVQDLKLKNYILPKIKFRKRNWIGFHYGDSQSEEYVKIVNNKSKRRKNEQDNY